MNSNDANNEACDIKYPLVICYIAIEIPKIHLRSESVNLQFRFWEKERRRREKLYDSASQSAHPKATRARGGQKEKKIVSGSY